jgi:hypothetical protein
MDVEQEQASGLAGELLDGHSFGQTFALQYDGLYRIDLYTATYARENTHPVIFRVRAAPNAEEDLVRLELPAAEISNSGPTVITFPPLAGTAGKPLYLSVESPGSVPGDAITVYRHEYRNTDRGRTDHAEFGMAKFICDRRGMLLGAHILGERAGELIHEAQLLRHLGLPFTTIASMIHIYPTFADVVRQPAKLLYVDRLRNNPVLKLLAKVLGKKK